MPAALSASVMPVPVAKSMPSWQAPQATMLGLFIQLLPLAVTLAVRALASAVPLWHLVQLAGDCGKPKPLYMPSAALLKL